MLPSRLPQLVFASLLAAFAFGAAAQTPAPNTTEWESEPLSLRLFYPSDLVKADAAQVVESGHLTLFGISTATDVKLAEATRCLRPTLLLQLPPAHPSAPTTSQPAPDGGTVVTNTPATTATVLLAELDITCLSEQQQVHNTTLLPEIAGIVSKVPGMTPIAPPSTYTIGWQKVYMAAAQGQPQTPADPASARPPTQIFTMAISTNWNNHLLVWYFSSNNIDTLNRITKTTVRFGRAQAAPLYPVAIGSPAPQ